VFSDLRQKTADEMFKAIPRPANPFQGEAVPWLLAGGAAPTGQQFHFVRLGRIWGTVVPEVGQIFHLMY
jgi:hypothetical protein